MHANVGDWLVVRSHKDDERVRRAQILAVHPDGAPPFTVRWTEDDHESIVFPGPDAEILTTKQLTERDHIRTGKIAH